MSFKRMPPPPPGFTEECTCPQPDPVDGRYCGRCGKLLRNINPQFSPPPTRPSSPPPAGPPVTKPVSQPPNSLPRSAPVQKPMVTKPMKPAKATASHPLEARFLKNMGFDVDTGPAPSPQPVSKPAPVSKPTGLPTGLPTNAPKPGGLPPGFKPPAGIVPPSQLPNPLSTAPPKAISKPVAKPAAAGTAAPAGENLNLGFDLEEATQELDEETKFKLQFESIMDRFKEIITNKTKILPYEFADELGIADKIEEFYEFLNQKDKDGIIALKKDEVRINKTKLMGGLMLGDNSMLERALDRFRAWLETVLK